MCKVSQIWSRSKRREFLDSVYLKLNLRKSSDWGKVTQKTIIECGGRYLLLRCYSGSIFRMLKDVYSDIDWKKDWFQNLKSNKGHWFRTSNRKSFFESLAKDLNIKTQQDWAKLTNRKLAKMGALSILNEYYQGSLFKALQHLFPGIFPRLLTKLQRNILGTKVFCM